MSEKEYIARGEMLSELRSGFFPQDVVYTEAVSIAEQIIRAAPAADVVPRSEVERIVRTAIEDFAEKVREQVIIRGQDIYLIDLVEKVMLEDCGNG